MKKETIFIQKDGTQILQGKICPFRAPLVLPSQSIAGQLTIQNIPCTSACTLFNFHKDIRPYVNIKCGIGNRYEVDIIEEEKEEQIKSNLIIT